MGKLPNWDSKLLEFTNNKTKTILLYSSRCAKTCEILQPWCGSVLPLLNLKRVMKTTQRHGHKHKIMVFMFLENHKTHRMHFWISSSDSFNAEARSICCGAADRPHFKRPPTQLHPALKSSKLKALVYLSGTRTPDETINSVHCGLVLFLLTTGRLRHDRPLPMSPGHATLVPHSNFSTTQRGTYLTGKSGAPPLSSKRHPKVPAKDVLRLKTLNEWSSLVKSN